jgi:cytoskeletal protein RodZ
MKSSRSEFPRELVQCRKGKPISLRQISDSTKISMCYLEAIECGDFHKLPAGIYATSYLRQYARAVAYDENILIRHYNDTVKQS